MVGKNKKNRFFRNNYFLSWEYIKSSRNFIYTAVVIFFIFSLIGFFIPAPQELSGKIMEFLEELLERTSGLSPENLIGFIFFNNLKGSFFGMLSGIFFGIFSILSLVVNGYLLGFVSSLSTSERGIFILWRLLPHGIFELPALFISLGLGLRLGSFIFQEKKIEFLKKSLLNSLRVFLFVVVPLLIIAAIIEGSFIFFFP
jgi:stage II sporulation protein M